MCKSYCLILPLLFTITWNTIHCSQLLRNRYRNLPVVPGAAGPAAGAEFEDEDDCMFNICEADPEFPEGDIVEWMRLMKPMDSYFGSVHGIADEVDDDFYESRLGHVEEDEVLCQVRSKTFRPQSMLNVHNQKRFLINVQTPDDKSYTMKFKSELCHNEAKCSPVFFLNTTVERKCVQKFGEIRLLSFDKKNKKILYDLFPYPTTCVCKEFFL